MKTLTCKLVFANILIVLLILPFKIYSQEKPMRIGAKGGWNYAFNNLEAANGEVQGKHGFVGGGVFEYWFSDLFAINSNVLYNMKGNEWKVKEGFLFFVETSTVTWALNYLSIPVSAKFAFGDQVKFYLLIGPEFSFLLSGEEITKGEDSEEMVELKDVMNSFEIAGNFGFGLDIKVDPVVLFFEVRGSLSLGETFKEDPPGTVQLLEEGAIKNIVPSLSAGVLYPLGN